MLYNNDSLAESSKNKMRKSGENKKGIVREEKNKTAVGESWPGESELKVSVCVLYVCIWGLLHYLRVKQPF